MAKTSGIENLLEQEAGVMIGERGLIVKRMGGKYYLFTANDDIKSVQISSHGGLTSRWSGETPWFNVPKGIKLYFYGPHGWVLSDYGFKNFLRTSPKPYEIYEGGEKCRNYSLSKYQGRHNKIKGELENYEAIMLLIRNRLMEEGELDQLDAVTKALRNDSKYKRYNQTVLETQQTLTQFISTLQDDKNLLTGKTLETVTSQDIDDAIAGIDDGSLLSDAEVPEKEIVKGKLKGIKMGKTTVATHTQYAQEMMRTYNLMDMCTLRNRWWSGGGTLKTAVTHLHELGYTDVHCSFCRGGKEPGYTVGTHQKPNWIPRRPGRALKRKNAFRRRK